MQTMSGSQDTRTVHFFCDVNCFKDVFRFLETRGQKVNLTCRYRCSAVYKMAGNMSFNAYPDLDLEARKLGC